MYNISDNQVAPKIKIKKNGQKLQKKRVNYAKNIFNPFEYIFLGFSLDSQGLPKDLPGFSLAKSKKIQGNVFKWIKKYS